MVMNNKMALLVSGALLAIFFLTGLLDIMYDLDILNNLVSQLILFGTLIMFIIYLVKVNTDKHKKNLLRKTGSPH